MTDFETLGLAEPLLRAVAAEGYAAPTPIQAQGIPPMLAGRDLLGMAQTGTGKTASFVLPILHRLLADRRPAGPKSCRALILAPTRELAAQIADNVKGYGRFAKIRHAVVVGGVKPGGQIRAMAPGVDVLIATPGRLLDHMAGGAIRLMNVETLVLDEADQMLDIGFLPAIRKIVAKLPADRRTALFSATMPPAIRALAADIQTDPVEIAIAPEQPAVERIAQTVRFLAPADKRAALVEVLGADDVRSAVVFTRTKRGADRVAQHLDAAGLPAAAIHGNKSQSQRTRALDAFRSGRAPILVATDIAARGIDVDGVSHVVNYELPNVPEAYVHRIGRTARAGADGVAVAFCDPGEERPLLRDIERLLGAPIPRDGPEPPAPARTPRQPGAAPARKRRRRGGAGRAKAA